MSDLINSEAENIKRNSLPLINIVYLNEMIAFSSWLGVSLAERELQLSSCLYFCNCSLYQISLQASVT